MNTVQLIGAAIKLKEIDELARSVELKECPAIRRDSYKLKHYIEIVESCLSEPRKEE